MMGYQVLDRPEGTSAYDPGFMQNVTSAAKALEDWMKKQEKKKKDAAIREAIKKEQLIPEYKYDPEKETWTEEWKKKEVKETDPVKEFKKKIQQKLVLGEKISQADTDAYNRVAGINEPRIPDEMIETPVGPLNVPGQPASYNPQGVTDWTQVPWWQRVKSALTPSATPEESRLGGLRIGGIFKPPTTTWQPELSAPVKLPGIVEFPRGSSGPKPLQEIFESVGPTRQDPRIVARISELRKQGMKDTDIANALKEKGVDSSLYGL
jgi:hypothetical protein